MDPNSMSEEENQSPSVLKLRTIELENRLLIEKQRYILLQSELESSMTIASKHLDLYKNECMSLKEKLSALENHYNLLKNKELKSQETIKNLLKKIERVGKECGSEIQKKWENLKKNDKEVKQDAYDDAMDNEGENTQVFVDLDSDCSDDNDAMKHSPELKSDDSFVMINSECKTPRKKFKSSSDSTLFNDGNKTGKAKAKADTSKKADSKLSVKGKAAEKPKKEAKKAKAPKDPFMPKRPPSAFFVFMEDFRKIFKETNPDNKQVSAVGKAAGDKWKSMTAFEKAPYEAKAAKRKAEYIKTMAAYNKKLSDGASKKSAPEEEEEEAESDKSKSDIEE